MTFMLIALLLAFAAMTAVILADSGLRLWSALGGIRLQQAMLGNGGDIPVGRTRGQARVTTRVSYARPAVTAVSAQRRAAA